MIIQLFDFKVKKKNVMKKGEGGLKPPNDDGNLEKRARDEVSQEQGTKKPAPPKKDADLKKTLHPLRPRRPLLTPLLHLPRHRRRQRIQPPIIPPRAHRATLPPNSPIRPPPHLLHLPRLQTHHIARQPAPLAPHRHSRRTGVLAERAAVRSDAAAGGR